MLLPGGSRGFCGPRPWPGAVVEVGAVRRGGKGPSVLSERVPAFAGGGGGGGSGAAVAGASAPFDEGHRSSGLVVPWDDDDDGGGEGTRAPRLLKNVSSAPTPKIFSSSGAAAAAAVLVIADGGIPGEGRWRELVGSSSHSGGYKILPVGSILQQQHGCFSENPRKKGGQETETNKRRTHVQRHAQACDAGS